mmetsp:Transcript_9567/g.21423  ORF Transcript_9567/g.21423 Transcript_9567/m.21423 type:complete len:319 (+) Transcript_9567:13-969(+)
MPVWLKSFWLNFAGTQIGSGSGIQPFDTSAAMTIAKKQIKFAGETASPTLDASVITACLLRGLADHPAGPDRSKACGARRLEVLEGIGQVQQLLFETEWELSPEQGDSAVCSLSKDRLDIAFSMILGLEQGVSALEWLEMSDAFCDASQGCCPGPTTWAPRSSSSSCSPESAEISTQLALCRKRARELSDKLADLPRNAEVAALPTPESPKQSNIARCDSKAEVAASLALTGTILDSIAVNLVVGLSRLADPTEKLSPLINRLFLLPSINRPSRYAQPLNNGKPVAETDLPRLGLRTQASDLDAYIAKLTAAKVNKVA